MYKYKLLRHFVKQTKGYIKKFPKLFEEILKTLRKFDKKNATPLGNNIFKLRVSLPGLHRGKNRSFRLIILIIEVENTLIPMAFYFKGDRQSISKKEIILHKKIIEHELEL